MNKKTSILFLEYGIGSVVLLLIFFGYMNVSASPRMRDYRPACSIVATIKSFEYINVRKGDDCSWIKPCIEDQQPYYPALYLLLVTDASTTPLRPSMSLSRTCKSEYLTESYITILADKADKKRPFIVGQQIEADVAEEGDFDSYVVQELPKTIEDAVRASGGTYGTINTNDPNAANNFVDTVFDDGLTNSDRNVTNKNGNCFYGPLKSGMKISCGLNTDGTAAYFYDGEKGERITVTVLMKKYIPTISITDANGAIFSVDTHTQKDTPFTITKILPYSGNYQFQIYTQEFVKNKDVEQSFSISFASDKTHIQPDIRKDSLIEGKNYSVSELNGNVSTTSRKFFVEAYVNEIYKDPCVPGMEHCKISLLPNITISEYSSDMLGMMDIDDPIKFKKRFATVFTNRTLDESVLEVGNKKYLFEVNVINTSLTDVPNNRFTLVSIDGETTTTLNRDDLKINKGFFRNIWSWFSGLFGAKIK